ncbi:MAG TPA: Rpn family recombination-promoting nuclease/putative transposase [Blastocatellia bacterium]|nr:Rpn family recombination-promoting nuclease/putative transposase [Blastocatellia bacterium]HMZ17844.1 Rpn family recombination-promoting nuclease/putative transposase [Blastocatellia bacterium]HNG29704.1 Rpn family recombination-promoting nuclease/putative transposase [Blastocatellia bacterium]
MNFIDPRTDFAFKKIFGSERSKPILLSFLNALLHDEQPIIVDLEIIDPSLAPKVEGMKDTFVDVRARLADGRRTIIEMQVLNVEGFEKRVLYNAAKAYSTQLLMGEAYKDLSPVVALTITDFVMFPETAAYESFFVLKDRKDNRGYPLDDLQLVFAELPKFDKSLEELDGVKEKWLYFLRHARELRMIPTTMEAVGEIRSAFEMAQLAGLSAEEMEVYERKMMYLHDQRGALALAQKEGHAEGRAEERAEIARKLLARFDDDAAVAELTGLTPAEVAALRNEKR